MEFGSFVQSVTNSQKIKFLKYFNTEKQEFPKLVGTYLGLTRIKPTNAR